MYIIEIPSNKGANIYNLQISKTGNITIYHTITRTKGDNIP